MLWPRASITINKNQDDHKIERRDPQHEKVSWYLYYRKQIVKDFLIRFIKHIKNFQKYD